MASINLINNVLYPLIKHEAESGLAEAQPALVAQQAISPGQLASELLFLNDHYPERLKGIDCQKGEEIRERAKQALLELEKSDHPEQRPWAHEMIRDADNKALDPKKALKLFFEGTSFSYTYETLWATKIAHILIDHTGRINRSLIPLVVETLFSRNDISAADTHIKETLLKLYENPKLVDIIEEIHEPDFLYKDVIRATLFIDSEKKVTAQDAHELVLAAALTRCRQIIGNCYVNATAQHIQISSLEEALRDLSELIQTGNLSALIDSQRVLFPGACDLNNDLLLQSFDFTTLSRRSFIEALFAIPHFAYAFRFLGVTQDTLQTMLNGYSNILMYNLFFDLQKELHFSNVNLAQALFFVQSGTKMPILQCWENALTGMLFPPMTSRRAHPKAQKVFLYPMLRALGDVAEEAGKQIPALLSFSDDLAPLRSFSRTDELERQRMLRILRYSKQKAGQARARILETARQAMIQDPFFISGTAEEKLEASALYESDLAACDDFTRPFETRHKQYVKQYVTLNCEKTAAQFVENARIKSHVEAKKHLIHLNQPQYRPLDKFRLVPVVRREDVWVTLEMEENGFWHRIYGHGQEDFGKYCREIFLEILSTNLTEGGKIELQLFFTNKKDPYFSDLVSSYFLPYYKAALSKKEMVDHKDAAVSPFSFPLDVNEEWADILLNKHSKRRKTSCTVTMKLNTSRPPLVENSRLLKTLFSPGSGDFLCSTEEHTFRVIPDKLRSQDLSTQVMKKNQSLCKNLLISQCPEIRKAVMELGEDIISSCGKKPRGLTTQKIVEGILRKESKRGRPVSEANIPMSRWLHGRKKAIKKISGADSEDVSRQKIEHGQDDSDDLARCKFYKAIYRGFMKDQPILASSLQIHFGDSNSDEQTNKRSIPVESSFYFNPCTLTWQYVESTQDENYYLSVEPDEDEIRVFEPNGFKKAPKNTL